MAQVRRSVVKEVTIPELLIGDKLLVAILGYKNRVLFHQGTTLDARAILFLKKQRDQNPPVLASEQYQTGKKAHVDIKTNKGKVLVKGGELITNDAIRPLAREGFTSQPLPGGDAVLYTRSQTWPKDVPWNIEEINPYVTVETTVTVNADVQETPDEHPVGAGAGKARAATESATKGSGKGNTGEGKD